MKYIGIDYGTANIGVAFSDDGGSVAFPHSVISADRGALSAVAALIKEKGALAAVIGESRNFAGEKNEVMEDIEQFKKDLEELAAIPVEYEREFFTSAMAARQFTPEEKSRKANPSQDTLDASAAALILQSYLDRNKKVITDGHITIGDFKKVEIQIGKILSAEPIEGSDKLLRLRVDFGDHERQVLSGIKAYFPEPASLVGKKCPFVTNLAPRTMMGLESQAMILATGGGDTPFSLFETTGIPGDFVR